MTALYDVLDDRFRVGAGGDQQLERLAGGCQWSEGPVYVPAGRYAIWSNIPNDRLLRWDETNGVVSTLRHPAGHINGNTLDREGRLISCEQGNRRVSRTEHDGSVTVLADRHDGTRLNGPSDAAVRSDGAVSFTDPDFGITRDYEGHHPDGEIGDGNVYRIDSAEGAIDLLIDGIGGASGILFSQDERTLFVCDSRTNEILASDVAPNGRSASERRVFVTSATGNGSTSRCLPRRPPHPRSPWTSTPCRPPAASSPSTAPVPGLTTERIGQLTLAVAELAANAVEHGGGSGELAVWTHEDHLVCRLADTGHLTVPLAGRIPVPPDAPTGGRGLLLVNQLCDLVRIHTTSHGTTVRIYLRR